MLAVIGADSVEQLFETIPAAVRLDHLLDLPGPWSEIEERRFFHTLAARNRTASTHTSFLGAGAYHHYQPACVDQLLLRGGVPDLVHSVPARGFARHTSGDFRIPDTSVHPHRPRRCKRIALRRFDRVRRSSPSRRTGRQRNKENRGRPLDPPRVPRNASHLHSEPRNRDRRGRLDRRRAGSTRAHSRRPFSRASSPSPYSHQTSSASSKTTRRSQPPQLEPNRVKIAVINEATSLGIVSPPGDHGFDVAVGEGQAWGIPPQFGGPYVGFSWFAIR